MTYAITILSGKPLVVDKYVEKGYKLCQLVGYRTGIVKIK